MATASPEQGPPAGALGWLSEYRTAFLDWLACACAGAGERAALAARGLGDDLPARVARAGVAGHVLDYDDTFPPGVAHVSAVCAPAALVVAAARRVSVGEMLEAYAAGFEAMAVCAEAGHPALYDAGWHPTSVCGPVGAAVAAGRLLGLGTDALEQAVSSALLRTGGRRGAFGSDGKAIQVGLAAAAGVQGALLAEAGALVGAGAVQGRLGFEGLLGAPVPALVVRDGRDAAQGRPGPGIVRNWIKLHASCLGTHAPIDAAAEVRNRGLDLDAAAVEVHVHPVAREAAHLDGVVSGLEAKFSIPYCVAHTLRHGPPVVGDFATVEAGDLEAATRVTVRLDSSLPEFGAALLVDGEELLRLAGPRGSPALPATPEQLAGKLHELAGTRLDGALDDPASRAAAVLEASGALPA